MDTGSNGNLVYNNICADNEGAGLAIVKSAACQVFHNTAVGNGFLPSAEFSPDLESQPGITVTNLPPEPGFSSADNVVVNNVAYDSRNIQISIEGGSGQTLQNNLLAQGPNSLTGPFYDQLFQVTNQTGATISGNLAATPVFDGDISQLGVNSFALATGSPGIASGADLSVFVGVLPVTLDADYAGAARNATMPTIGAFEVVPASDYEEWAAVAFAGSGVIEIGPDDDPDGDGIVNLFEFAYRLNPLIADMFAPLELDGLPSAAPDALELVVRLDEATLLTELQRTTDLGAWSSNELSFGLNGWATGDPDLQVQTAEFLGDDLWKLRVVDSHGDPKAFYRMSVDLR